MLWLSDGYKNSGCIAAECILAASYVR